MTCGVTPGTAQNHPGPSNRSACRSGGGRRSASISGERSDDDDVQTPTHPPPLLRRGGSSAASWNGSTTCATDAASASNLCPAFPSLFDMIDKPRPGKRRSDDAGRAGPRRRRVPTSARLCYVKCPYVPPHEVGPRLPPAHDAGACGPPAQRRDDIARQDHRQRARSHRSHRSPLHLRRSGRERSDREAGQPRS